MSETITKTIRVNYFFTKKLPNISITFHKSIYGNVYIEKIQNKELKIKILVDSFVINV